MGDIMKKLFFIFIIILFFIGFYKSVSAEEIKADDYKTISSSPTYYEYSYVNEKSYDISFEGYVIYDEVPLEGYSRFHLYSNNQIYIIFTNYNNIPKFISSNENNYKTLIVGSINYDAYDYILNKCPYNYMYIAKYHSFKVEANSTYTSKDLISYHIEMYKDTINFKKSTIAYVPWGYYMDPYDENDYAWFLGVVSMYQYQIELLDKEYGDNEVILKFKVSNSFGHIRYRDLHIIRCRDSAPAIISNSDVIPIDKNNPKSYEEIKSMFKAIDLVEGDVSNRITIDTLYDYKNPIPGEYNLEVFADDSEGYEASIKLKIVVFDSSDLIKNHIVNLSYKREYEYDEIMAFAGLKENTYYEVVDENYSDDYSKLGESYFNVRIYNEYGFDYLIELTINVIDDEVPIIKTTPITISTNKELTDTDILNNIVVDDYTNVSIKIIKDNFKNDTIGSYDLKIIVTDEYNNESIAYITVNVINSNNINFYNNTIRVYNDYVFSTNEIINFLKDISNNKYNDDVSYEVISKYFDSPSEPGEYQATLRAILQSGDIYEEEYTIEVLEVKKEKKKKKINIFKRIWKIIKYFFMLIINLIKKIFKFIFH